MMEFPLLDLTVEKWDWLALSPIFFDDLVYTKSDKKFKQYFEGRLCCDCKGDVYKIVGKKPLAGLLRTIFSFVPGVAAGKLIFERQQRRLNVEEVRAFMLRQINETDDKDYTTHFIEHLLQAKSIRELLN